MRILSKINLSLSMVILAGAILRLYNITAISLWHDESFSALLLRYPLGEMMHRIALDVHPPLYYILLRGWDFVLGDSLFSLRLFSVFFGVLTIYFAYLFIKAAFKNERLALVSAALIAFNPFQIQYAVEARMYTLGTFLIVFSSWILVKAIEAKKVKWWLAYGISAALAIYTHYYLIFSVAAQAVFILALAIKNYRVKMAEGTKSPLTILKADENIRGTALAYATAIVVYLPWIGIFLKQLGQVEQNYWIPKMSASSLPNTLWRMISGSNVDISGNANINSVILAAISIVFLAILAWVYKKETNRFKNLIILSFLIPFILAIVFSIKTSLYLDRYFVFAGLFYLMIFAMFFAPFGVFGKAGFNSGAPQPIKDNIRQNIFAALFILLSFVLFAQNWKTISPSGKTGMRGASDYIFQNAKPSEKVFIASSFAFFTYKYYAYQNLFSDKGYPRDFNPSELEAENNVVEGYRIYPEYMTPLLYTPGITEVEQLPHFSGTALLTKNDLLNDFNAKVKRSDTVWVLWTTGFGGSKPEVPASWIQADEAGFLDVFGYRGWIVATKYKVQ